MVLGRCPGLRKHDGFWRRGRVVDLNRDLSGQGWRLERIQRCVGVVEDRPKDQDDHNRAQQRQYSENVPKR
jgi:hypothetical protein